MLRIIAIAVVICVCQLGVFINAPAEAEPVYKNDISRQLGLRIYEWDNLGDSTPRAIVVAIHAFLLDGTRYNTIAHALNEKNIRVLAPDMRGFGHWYRSKEPEKRKLDYKKSEADIVELLNYLKKSYPNIPIICMGESMGSNLLVDVIAKHQLKIDGLIISSPCAIRKRTMFRPRALCDVLISIILPLRQIYLVPYFMEYAVDDDNIEVSQLTRTRMGLGDLLRTFGMLSKSMNQAQNVSASIPVLVIQGERDKLCKISKIKNLVTRLPSIEKTFDLVPHGGHLFLETDEIPHIVSTVIDQWLEKILQQWRNEK